MTRRNKANAELFRGQACIVRDCNKRNTVGDHISPYKRDPRRDILENMWPLCIQHHDEKGRMPLKDFVSKHWLENELINRGFFKCELTGNWKRNFE